MTYKKLIEVTIPLEEINKESAREKSIRHGHPSTLHLWWARRPLAAARAVIFSSLVDDPSEHPELFPTEEEQNAERDRLFDLIKDLVKWENTNNEDVLRRAKAEISKYTGGNPPALLDPFAGGGSIPLEAQRLGLEAHAHDLNPVAVMINKAMIEIPPRFAGKPPVNPESSRLTNDVWRGTAGLAEDVKYYGEWMKQEAFKRIGHLYPKVKVSSELGGEATIIAWIWARTIKCPNPACGAEMPLANTFVLSKKRGNEAYIQPVIKGKRISYEVKYGKNAPEAPKTGRGANFKCICCGESTTPDFIKSEAMADRMKSSLMAIVAEGSNKRLYTSPDIKQIEIANVNKPEGYPIGELSNDKRAIWTPLYGLNTFDKLFTPRQLTALTTFSSLVNEAAEQAEKDAIAAGMKDDSVSLSENGKGAKAYGQAISVYLSFLVDKLADLCNSLNRWEPNAQCPRQLFARQAIPMIWDYAEGNPLGNSSGSWSILLKNLIRCFSADSFVFEREKNGKAMQSDAQSDCGLRNVMISTDPPYYDNIGYADLSDFFYVWMRQSLKDIYPELFRTMLVPKAEELVATPYRFEGSTERARDFFELGMLKTCEQLWQYTRDDVPVTIYYAYKQSESDELENEDNEVMIEGRTSSTGWETMLTAIIKAGFSITGTWPMRTECISRSVAQGSNALASSIVLVCRKRPTDAPSCTLRDFRYALKRELRPALIKLQKSNIAPVDLAQSAIGPGMAVYSSFSKVLEADGTPMSVRTALQIINQELDSYFTEQDGELDSDSRFCVDLFSQYAFNIMPFGDADVLARARNASIDKLVSRGALYAQRGEVRLLRRDEMPETMDAATRTVWLLTQHLTHAMTTGGVEKTALLVKDMPGAYTEQARALAYRLFTIAERKGWTGEAFAYNSLVVSWPDVQSKVAKLREMPQGSGQLNLPFTD